MSSSWPVVAAALGGASITASFAYVTAAATAKRQQRGQQRDARRHTYVEVLHAANEVARILYGITDFSMNDTRETAAIVLQARLTADSRQLLLALNDLERVSLLLQLEGPQDVFRAGDALVKEISDWHRHVEQWASNAQGDPAKLPGGIPSYHAPYVAKRRDHFIASAQAVLSAGL